MATKARHLKTAIQLWVADQRKAGRYTSQDLADWTGVTVDTARGWESRGRPSDEAIQVLEQKFGRPAPRTETPSGGDQTALVLALEAQTTAINELVVLLRPMAESQALQVADLQKAVQRLLFERGLPTAQGRPVPQDVEG